MPPPSPYSPATSCASPSAPRPCLPCRQPHPITAPSPPRCGRGCPLRFAAIPLHHAADACVRSAPTPCRSTRTAMSMSPHPICHAARPTPPAMLQPSPPISMYTIMGQTGVCAFLQSVLRDLSAVIGMRHDLFLDFNSELNILEKMLLRLQDFLVDAERRRVVEKCVDEWMDELKDFLYDADYLLDEINMEKQQLRQASDGQTSNIQVSHIFSGAYYTSNNIKNTLGEVLGRIEELGREAVCLELKRDVGLHSANRVASQALIRPKMGPFADVSEIHGREKDKDKIIEMLLAEEVGRGKKNYDVVCVVGMGGLGKTTLAQFVFQDERVCSCSAVKSWACVSDVFDVVKVTKELIESAEQADGSSNMQSQAGLQACLKIVINKKRFLLVLDDVWTTNEWDNLKAPLNFGAKGSKILVTTRLRRVAEVVSNELPYQLGRLEDEQCLAIFNDNAFGEIDKIDNDADLMKMGAEIARKCGGVPLVAKVIGAMLRGEDDGKWKAVIDNDLWTLPYEDENFHPGLRLSYFYLPSFLKRCFEYFALFPSDFIFNQDELVRMLMAEGLIEVKEGTELEEIGSQYYNNLKGRSLIQENNMIMTWWITLLVLFLGVYASEEKNVPIQVHLLQVCGMHLPMTSLSCSLMLINYAH